MAELQAVRAADVLSKLEALHAKTPGGAAAFDGDGTLWSGDVGEDFFFAFVEHGDIREPAARALADLAKARGLDPKGEGSQIARRLFAAYERGDLPEESICEIIAWLPAGWGTDELVTWTRTQWTPPAVRSRFQEETLTVLEGARRVGVEVFVISASPRVIVEVAAAVAGVDAAHVLAATPGTKANRIEARVAERIPYGAGKVVHLRGAIAERPLWVACGDNVFDVELLREASIPCAVRPKARLLARAADVPGLRRLEK